MPVRVSFTFWVSFFAHTFASAVCAQTTYFVDTACGSDAWSGTTQTCTGPDGPKQTIQSAIDASVTGDTVRVADGVYTGVGNRDIDFGGRDILLVSKNGPNRCAIDVQATGSDQHRAFYFHTGETNAAIVDGFAIRHGYASAPLAGGNHGGAIYCIDSSPTIRRCDMTSNFAEHGSAIYLHSSGAMVLECRFVGNSVGAGGGMYVVGGSDPRIEHCVFSANELVYQGGAIFMESCTGTIINCLFVGNTAAWEGGGVCCSFDATPAVINCTFAHNLAGMEGGGLAVEGGNPTVVNCLFWENTNGSIFVFPPSPLPCVSYSDVQGGFPGDGNIQADPAFTTVASGMWTADGVYDKATGTTTYTNDNASFGANVLAGMFVNPNTGRFLQAPILSNTTTTITVLGELTFSILAGRSYAVYDYRTSAGSPIIDAGNNTAVPVGTTTDLLDNPRFADDLGVVNTGVPGGTGGPAVIDIGAFEFQDQTCYADCDGDGVLDTLDYVCFGDVFTAGGSYADCNGNGSLNILDYICFGDAFATGCP